MSIHSTLAPSAAERWLSCPASIRMSEAVPEGPDSVYAREGTAAHALAELMARDQLLNTVTGAQLKKALEAWREEFDISPDAEAEMAEHGQAYVDYLRSRLEAGENSKLLLEQRLPTGVPDCWGTSDAVIVSPTVAESVDYKYGLGVRVEAQDNPQLRLYGIGALEAFGDLLGEVELVRLTIFQPRLGHVDTEELAASDLRAWRDSILPIAEQALGPDAPFGPSEEACRWCPASGRCVAQMEHVVQRDFGTFDDDFDDRRKEYDRRHDAIRQARGTAKEKECHNCGKTALDWSQIHGTDGEHPDHYVPRCRSCHAKYDNVAREFMTPGRPALPSEVSRLASMNKKKFRCAECAVVSNLGGLVTHQKHSGHEGSSGPEVMGDNELAEALDQIPGIKAWCAAVEAYTLHRVYSESKPIPGYKVVMSGGKRSIVDHEGALESLLDVGYNEDAVSTRKVKGIGDLEKLLKRSFDEIVGPFVKKGDGSPSLVPDSDKRQAINPEARAAEDFS